MKDQFKHISKELANLSFPEWNNMPDIDLYMDQVMTYLERELKPLKVKDDDKILTNSMINNYVKGNLLPAPNHKKYSKEHLSRLFIISSIKQILSISSIEQLLNSGDDINDDLYKLFTEEHKTALKKETEKLDSALDILSDKSEEELINAIHMYIIHLAIHAEAQKIIAEKLINVLEEKKLSELSELERQQKEEKAITKQNKKNKAENAN